MTALTCGSFAVALESSDRELLSTLEHFFYWRRGECSEPDWKIKVDDAIDERIGHQNIPFEFQERAELIAEIPRTLRVLSTGGVISIDAEQRRCRISNASSRGRFLDTYRTARQLLVADRVARGFTCIHAGAVVRDGKAVIFLGDKGRGKTTTISHLGASFGFTLLSNDKLFLHDDGSLAHFPEAPAVTVQTLLSLPNASRFRYQAVRDRDSRASDYFLDHPALPAWSDIEVSPPNRRIFFSEQEYAHVLGAETECMARLAGVVVLELPRGESAHVRDLEYLDWSPYMDSLEPFGDWTALRSAAPTALRPHRGGVVAVKGSNDIAETSGVLDDVVCRLLRE